MPCRALSDPPPAPTQASSNQFSIEGWPSNGSTGGNSSGTAISRLRCLSRAGGASGKRRLLPSSACAIIVGFHWRDKPMQRRQSIGFQPRLQGDGSIPDTGPAARCRSRILGTVILAVLGCIVATTSRAGPIVTDDSTTGQIIVRQPSLLKLVHDGHLAGHSGTPRVAIAMSGGGARGLAQIGVLRALEEANISIDLICAVSMGAVIGGLYTSGISPDSLEKLARVVRWTELLQNSPPRGGLLLSQKDKSANWFVSIPMRNFHPQWPTGATSGQTIYNFISNLTEGASYRCEADFDSLPVRYRAVATELVSGQQAVFAKGQLAFAIRAAMAFPLAVTPLRHDSLLYADGGLVDPLPVELAHECSPVAPCSPLTRPAASSGWSGSTIRTPWPTRPRRS